MMGQTRTASIGRAEGVACREWPRCVEEENRRNKRRKTRSRWCLRMKRGKSRAHSIKGVTSFDNVVDSIVVVVVFVMVVEAAAAAAAVTTLHSLILIDLK